MASFLTQRGSRVVAVTVLALSLGAGIAPSAGAAVSPCYPADTCNPTTVVTGSPSVTNGVSASINNMVPGTTVTWTWTDGVNTFTQTSAVDANGVAYIVMPIGTPGTYTVTASGFTTNAQGQQVPVSRQFTQTVSKAPSLTGTLAANKKKTKVTLSMTPPTGVDCGQFRFRLEYKKKKGADYYKRIDRTYYTTGADHKLTVNPSAGKGWYRAVVVGKCGYRGLITSPLVWLKG